MTCPLAQQADRREREVVRQPNRLQHCPDLRALSSFGREVRRLLHARDRA